MKRIISQLLITACITLLMAMNVNANDFTRIQNRWKANQYINIEKGPVVASNIEQGWWSAQWQVLPIQGTKYVRIKNRWKGTYLHNQNRRLESGSIQMGWWSAQWELINISNSGYFQIKNRWTGEYIHNQNGKVQLGAIKPGWWSAQWRVKKSQSTTKPVTMPAKPAPTRPTPKPAPKPSRPLWSSAVKYSVNIDCVHAHLSDTHTANRITVKFYAGSALIASKYKNGAANDVLGYWPTFVTNTREKITHVVVSTNGGDALFIDQLQVFKNNERILWEGRDNGGGWCLSTDARDANGDWSGNIAGNVCRSSYRFNLR
ncbi:MAG: hypothetical protein AAGI38_08520 [Bacteroidota bacterium]